MSRDGTQIAVVAEDNGNHDIYTWDLSRDSPNQTLMRLTFAPSSDTYPVWSRDGRIIHGSLRQGWQNLYRRSADRGGTEERLTEAPANQRPLARSPDDRQLIFDENTTDTAWNLMRLTLDGTATAEPLLRTKFDERNAALSPDGQWMAYESNETGPTEVFVRPFPNVTDAVFRISQTPSTFFDGRQANGSAYRMFDVSQDGQRFLGLKNAGAVDSAATRLSIVVVHN